MTAVRPDDTAGTGERSIEAIERRWHTNHDRGAHDYTDAGCRILAEHAFRDIPALVAAVREAEARAERAERALRQIVALDQEHAWIGQVEIARAALAAVSGEAPNERGGVCLLCGSAVLNGEHLRDDLAPCFGEAPNDE